MLTQDRDEELFLFLELRRLEKGSDHCKSSTTTMTSQRYPLRRTAADNFLYSEDEKSDYDWLVTPPGSPSKSLMNQHDANPMALNSLLQNCREEEKDSISSKNQTIGLKRPSSSNSTRSTSRPSTPNRRSTTTSRATLISSSTSSSRVTSRHSTPTRRPSSSSGTSRATLTAARAILSSSTRSSRTASRPSTPTSRPSSSGTSRASLTAHATTLTAQNATSTRSNTKPGSRSSTPTRRPPTPTGSSTVLKSKPAKPTPSPALRTRPWEPYEMPGFSIEAPSNLRTTLPDRPQTASSRRTIAFGTSTSRSASMERTVARRQSCSPSRDRAPIGNANRAVPSLRGRRAKTSNDDGGSISPVTMGDQKAERVVNMRKLAPPRLPENLSKSSIDMALRHMDVKRGSMTGNFRQPVTKVPTASVYSVRSVGTRRKRPVSSSGSSESSVNILFLDGSDDNLSERSYS
ncbi:unnamed protein product [Microthlaspi erraticum]|uniref:Uncharacterized protein n=1 Tax=Microthlaspi erraticum TaxID=1685480 RepID=A0A6D2LA91_9BRAS|nr:unnamed protein product [Microthlaspi erraticum]